MIRYDLNLFEVWKPIPGNPEYEISSEGRVWSNKTNKIIKQHPNEKGYYRVSINGVKMSVARLVCMTFIPNSNPDLNEVNHIDEDKSNNSVKNLEWCDRSYNINYGSRLDKQRETCYQHGIWSRNYEGLSKVERRRQYKLDHIDKVKEQKKKNYLKNRDYYLNYYKNWRYNKKKEYELQRESRKLYQDS